MNLGQAIVWGDDGVAHLVNHYPGMSSVLALELARQPVHAYVALKPTNGHIPPDHRNPLGQRELREGTLASRMLQGLKEVAPRKMSFTQLAKLIDCSNSRPNRQVLWDLVEHGKLRAQGAREARVYWYEREKA